MPPSPSSAFRALILSSLLACFACGGPGDRAPKEEADALIARLVAPCCYKQTLDVHAGDTAAALRKEITTRVGAGESAGAIEAELVARYGARVRALPSEDFLDPLALGLFGLVLVALGAVFRFGWRAARRPQLERPPAPIAVDSEARRRFVEELETL